jgi:hypothetical protein
VLKLMGLDLTLPDHITLSRRAGTRRSMNGPNGRSIAKTGPVHVLIDSTGLEVYGAGHWLAEKHGAKSRRRWRKLHLALDADTGEIIAQNMTDQDAGDASQVEPLLDEIDRPIVQFTADGAYDCKSTNDAVCRYSADAAVVIPPRSNAIDSSKSEFHSQRERHIEAIQADGRLNGKQRPAMASARWSRLPSADTKQSSDLDCELAPSAPNKQRSPSVAPPSRRENNPVIGEEGEPEIIFSAGRIGDFD